MVFKLSYSSIIFIFSFLTFSMFIPPMFLLLILMTTLLGYVFLKLILKNETMLKPILLFAFATGLILIAFITFLYKLLGLQLNIQTIIVFSAILFVLYLFTIVRKKEKINFAFQKKLNKTDLILIIIFYLSIFTRVYLIKDLAAPLTYDSIVVGTIARLITDNQGIPNSWEPYISTKMSYPPGYPSIIAWYSIFSNLPIPTIILFFSNFIQALIPLSVYAFSLVIFKNEIQSVSAAIISLIAAFPIFASLIGGEASILSYFLTIIALSIILSKIKLQKNVSYLIFLFIFSAGSFLVYPLYAFFLLLIIFPFFLKDVFSKEAIKNLKSYFMLFVVAILLPVLITSSYYFQFYVQKNNQGIISADWVKHAESLVKNSDNVINAIYNFVLEPVLYTLDGRMLTSFFSIDNLSAYDVLFIFIFFFSIFIIFKNKIKIGFTILLIYALFLLFSTVISFIQLKVFPIVDKLPLLYYVRPQRVGRFIFLPISLIFSYFFFETKRYMLFGKLNISSLILLVLIIVGVWNIINVIRTESTSSIISNNQMDAITWINQNTPKNATILNFVTEFDAGGISGDAAQWIPTITGRRILLPAISTPEDIPLEDIQKRLDVIRLVNDNKVDTSEFNSLIKKFNIDYIFITDKYLDSSNQSMIIKPEIFINNSHYKTVFHSEQTYVFQIKNS